MSNRILEWMKIAFFEENVGLQICLFSLCFGHKPKVPKNFMF